MNASLLSPPISILLPRSMDEKFLSTAERPSSVESTKITPEDNDDNFLFPPVHDASIGIQSAIASSAIRSKYVLVFRQQQNVSMCDQTLKHLESSQIRASGDEKAQIKGQVYQQRKLSHLDCPEAVG
jgi:hypothetical protein